MKMSDIIHKIADMLDQHDSPENSMDHADDSVEIVDVEKPKLPDHSTISVLSAAPLQQKLELLKKSVDVPNAFDQDEPKDELHDIKKLSGLPVIMQVGGEENDIV